MTLFNMLRNKKFYEQWDWIDGLSECGGYQTVGVGMIAKLHEVIRETYKVGLEEGKKIQREKVRALLSQSSRRIL